MDDEWANFTKEFHENVERKEAERAKAPAPWVREARCRQKKRSAIAAAREERAKAEQQKAAERAGRAGIGSRTQRPGDERTYGTNRSDAMIQRLVAGFRRPIDADSRAERDRLYAVSKDRHRSTESCDDKGGLAVLAVMQGRLAVFPARKMTTMERGNGRCTDDGLPSMDMPSVRQLLAQLTSEQLRLSQLAISDSHYYSSSGSSGNSGSSGQ
ncbi:unnamed protein product [Vitrella brassicaformis CCMP3155]|uniref:Uncharacterized protein n=1 Tax=Vitrella brassicaformis (strain CCMP3155) TaxID=1169540 RepID=A0A0G4EJV5_VITBC|nr:unnamed protein product [Vitrella brassicaformis CCMP3155]|eukprot:CEL96822.1 unnamed protein product [Vitrella brassicaformis CCMP3155]